MKKAPARLGESLDFVWRQGLALSAVVAVSVIADLNGVVNFAVQVLNISGNKADLKLSLADVDLNEIVISTVDDLAGAVINASHDVRIGVGELDVLFAALELCAELGESFVDAAEGSDAAGNRTTVVGVTVGAVSLILDIDDIVGVLAVCGDDSLSGLDIACLEVSVAGSGDIVGGGGVVLKNVVDDGGSNFKKSAYAAVAGDLAAVAENHGLLACGCGLGSLASLDIVSDYLGNSLSSCGSVAALVVIGFGGVNGLAVGSGSGLSRSVAAYVGAVSCGSVCGNGRAVAVVDDLSACGGGIGCGRAVILALASCKS